MAKRHEDRRPGQRFVRGGGKPSSPNRGRPQDDTGSAGSGSSAGGSSGYARGGKGKGGAGRGGGGAGRSRGGSSQGRSSDDGPARDRGPSKGKGGAYRGGSSGRGASGRGSSDRGGSARGGSGRADGDRARRPQRDAAPGARPVRQSRRRQQGIVVTPAERGPATDDGKVRLNHFLARGGIASRRAADELIAAGRIEVNGELVTELGRRIDPASDDVRFDGARVTPEKTVYVLLNKPKGVVCTNARHEQKKRAIDLLPQIRGRVFTVGRLDMDSEGLILLTNDGSFALEMTHPRYGVPKLYAVLVRGRVDEQGLQKARGGVWLSEGPTGGMQIVVERLSADRTYLKVTLREGKNREIRRVFARLGHPVISLKRVRIGHLNLHGLADGAWRFLDAREVEELRAVARGEDVPAPPVRRDRSGRRGSPSSRGGRARPSKGSRKR